MMCPAVCPFSMTLPRTQDSLINMHCFSTEGNLFYFYQVFSICLCSCFRTTNYPYVGSLFLYSYYLLSHCFHLRFLHSILFLSISFVLDTKINILADKCSSLLSAMYTFILFLLFQSSCSDSFPVCLFTSPHYIFISVPLVHCLFFFHRSFKDVNRFLKFSCGPW